MEYFVVILANITRNMELKMYENYFFWENEEELTRLFESV